jgi:hypothetical protein
VLRILDLQDQEVLHIKDLRVMVVIKDLKVT